MHSSSQGSSMAATLLQQKAFVISGTSSNNAGDVGSAGASGGSVVSGSVATTVEATVDGVGVVKTFIPITKTIRHHQFVPINQLPVELRANSKPGAYVVVSSAPKVGNNCGAYKSVQYRKICSNVPPDQCDRPADSYEREQTLEDMFMPLSQQPEPTSQSAAAPNSGCVWDAIEPPLPSPLVPASTNQTPINPQPGELVAHGYTGNSAFEEDAAGAALITDIPMNASDILVNNVDVAAEAPTQDSEVEPEPEIDIVINNVVCSFSVRCHLNLHEIALNGDNVEFRRENGMVTMKLRRPYTTASIWSSGKITCTGATSEEQAKVAARRYSRCLQKLGFNVRLRNFRIVNVLGTCSMPWGIKIVNFSEKYKKDASYEPELHPGVTYKLYAPRATLKIFSTGSITVTAASVAYVQAAIEHIFPLVYEFRKKRNHLEKLELLKQPPVIEHQDFDMEDGNFPVDDGPQEGDLLMSDGETYPGKRHCNGNTKAIDESNSIKAEFGNKGRRFVH